MRRTDCRHLVRHLQLGVSQACMMWQKKNDDVVVTHASSFVHYLQLGVDARRRARRRGRVLCAWRRTTTVTSSWCGEPILLHAATLSSHCHRTVIALSSHCHHTVITLSSHCHRTVVTLSSHCHHTAIRLASHWHRTVITLLSHCHHTVIALSSHCHHTVITLTSHCRHDQPAGGAGRRARARARGRPVTS